jgi:hypothetical protein
MSAGMRAAVDPTPLTYEQMRAHLIDGHHVYRMYMQAGKPTRLEYVTVPLLKLPAAPYGTYAASHGCGCHAMDTEAFEDPVDPPRAPVTVPRVYQGPSHATDVTQPRSRARCHDCGGVMEPGEYFAIEWPVWNTVTHHYQSRGPKKGYDRTFEGWGTETWAIHTDGCPGTNTNGNKK